MAAAKGVGRVAKNAELYPRPREHRGSRPKDQTNYDIETIGTVGPMKRIAKNFRLKQGRGRSETYLSTSVNESDETK